jgi:hypothetical protein
MARLSLRCSPLKESEDGCPVFLGLRRGRGSPPKFLRESKTGIGAGSATSGERRRREGELSVRGMISRQLNCLIGGAREGVM